MGEVRWVGAKAYPAILSSLEAEAAALAWVMRCLDNLEVEDVILETNSQNMLKALHDRTS